MHVYFGYLAQDAVPLNHSLLHNSENDPSFSCPFPAPVPGVKDQYVSARDNQTNLRGVQDDRVNGLILHPFILPFDLLLGMSDFIASVQK